MATVKTDVSELATAIGTLGHDLAAAFDRRPEQLANVDDATWSRLAQAYQAGEHKDLFTRSWLNGHAFLLASDGLRGRLPIKVEWRGPDKPVEQDAIPADLRIDNVFLVSVKDRSKLLANRSPSQVFLRDRRPVHWYEHTAPAEYQALYEAARNMVEWTDLPALVTELPRTRGGELGKKIPKSWPADLGGLYLDLSERCSTVSAAMWNEALETREDRQRCAWWLLRLASAPYFLLGDSPTAPLRIRIDTPWDWLHHWKFVDLEISPAGAGQPQVNWTIRVVDRLSKEPSRADGFVEIRWSHGRFYGHPEAKMQLRTPHEQVPGYTPLL